MLMKIKKIITIAGLSLASMLAFAADGEQDWSAAYIQKTVNSTMEKYHIPGMAVEVYVDGKPYEYYAGYAKPEQKEEVSRKTIFELGSISKVMTSVLFAQEVDWAKMGLTDPITKYLPNLPESWNEINLQDLATHTSGLPFNLPSNINDKQAFDDYVQNWKPKTGSEEQWIYSNVGIGVLGYALETSTEKSLDKLYYRHVMIPLNMVVGLTIPPALEKYYADGFDQFGNLAPHYNGGAFPAAGGVKASAADMQRFLAAAIGLPGTPPRILYPIRMTQAIYAKMGNKFQGLGWQFNPIIANDVRGLLKVSDNLEKGPITIDEIYDRGTYDGDALIDKTGTTGGFRAYIAVIPNKKSGIVILANKNVPNSAIVAPAREILFKLTKLHS
jgi:beta-lactamase class C